MLQCILIGHLGGDAQFKQANGHEFTSFRVAHTDRWTDEAGQVHETTTWVDCVMNGKPNVIEWLKKGQMVYVSGSCSLRVYSSPKDRCMKAGMQISVRQLELIGSKSDDIPNVLFDANTGAQVEVRKWFQVPSLVRDATQPEFYPLVSRTQKRFVADRNGWVQEFQGEE